MLDMIVTNPGANRPYDSDAARWAAVLGRDAAADGMFYYSVVTTGVYCRPSCAARTPNRDNVRFHDSPEAAARAGFRPCKRCRPNEAPPQA
ncbi:MAG: Ada metal-binding domain-containing protein, partial [Stellaceae bacterium]